MKADLDSGKKADIMIFALSERYASIHKIRERVQGICVWSLGLLAAASGWLIQTRMRFSAPEAVLIGLVLLLAYGALRFRYLDDLEIGFKNQMLAAVGIEKALHLYTPGFFTEGEEGLYPKKWEEAGSSTAGGNYFRKSYELLIIGLAIFILSLVFKVVCG